MKNIFISKLTIENVRHLKNIEISLTKENVKHLILTGKNGSGKTSVLEALSHYLNALISNERLASVKRLLSYQEKFLEEFQKQRADSYPILEKEKNLVRDMDELNNFKNGVSVEFSEPVSTLQDCFRDGQFILAYYKAERVFKADVPKHVEKVELQDNYMIDEAPRQVFMKYLLDLKVTEALARNNGNEQKANEIQQWFIKFQDLLRRIFDDESLELTFEEDSFTFSIKEKNREPFGFNTLSSGFAAVLDIIVDMIVRMENATNRSFYFNIPGIVLIDEIETHLHIELQKTILELLTTVFPNIQFIVSTHSPFILNSLENVVIYDLENQITVKNGLANVPYEGIVEGYFNASTMSDLLKKKFERYKELVKKENLTDDDFEEIAELELFLDEIPDYLALSITTEYQRLKLELESREDI